MTDFLSIIATLIVWGVIQFLSRNKDPKDQPAQVEQQENDPFNEWGDLFNQKPDPVILQPPPVPKKLTPAVEKKHPGKQIKKEQPLYSYSSVRPHVVHPPRAKDDISKNKRPSRALKAIKQLPHLNHMIIYQEILGPPKGLRPDP